jgi:hypothetical protein
MNKHQEVGQNQPVGFRNECDAVLNTIARLTTVSRENNVKNNGVCFALLLVKRPITAPQRSRGVVQYWRRKEKAITIGVQGKKT